MAARERLIRAEPWPKRGERHNVKMSRTPHFVLLKYAHYSDQKKLPEVRETIRLEWRWD
jgi:hypothetical protein